MLTNIVILSPRGREVIHDAFFSGEALSRNIARPFFFMGMGILVMIGALGWPVKLIIRKRRGGGATIV